MYVKYVKKEVKYADLEERVDKAKWAVKACVMLLLIEKFCSSQFRSQNNNRLIIYVAYI